MYRQQYKKSTKINPKIKTPQKFFSDFWGAIAVNDCYDLFNNKIISYDLTNFSFFNISEPFFFATGLDCKSSNTFNASST